MVWHMVSATPLPLRGLRRREESSSVRALADQAFSRAAGAALIPGNAIRLLKDAGENYPAWLEPFPVAPCPDIGSPMPLLRKRKKACMCV